MTRTARGRRARGLASRLFVAEVLVVIVGGATLWLVAAAAGPAIFRDHLHRALGHIDATTSKHVEEAFRSASAVSISVALAASLVAALAISAYVSRRIAGPVTRLADAAQQVAQGRYDARVASPAIGTEIATLTASFNAMAAKLESVETTRRRLLGDLAHEMRTPVATLDGYLEGLEDGVVAVTPQTLTMLRSQTVRLARLAEDIAAVSRAEEHQLELHPRPTAPARLVGAAVDAAREAYAERGVTLGVAVQPDLPTVLVDRDRFAQAMTNLLDNALRHTPSGGQVTISATADGGRVRLAVADSGDGIPAQHLPHVFERFYRVDRARDRRHGGSGIGLAIVKAIVDEHGGTVRADSAGSGRGSTFTITIPAR